MREGRLELIPGLPSCLIGIPYDRPVVGYGGKTINTLRLWAARRAETTSTSSASAAASSPRR